MTSIGCVSVPRASLRRRRIRLVATVIAWGAKFSEHPLCIADRHQNQGQSALAKVLIHRARDLAEALSAELSALAHNAPFARQGAS